MQTTEITYRQTGDGHLLRGDGTIVFDGAPDAERARSLMSRARSIATVTGSSSASSVDDRRASRARSYTVAVWHRTGSHLKTA